MKWSFTISTTALQPSCKIVTTLQGLKHLHKLPQPHDNLVTTTYKAIERLPKPSYFHMGTFSLKRPVESGRSSKGEQILQY